MGKGGSKPAPSSQTVTQTNLPEYAKPYFLNLLNRTQAESYRPYQTYGGDRIAGFTPAQEGLQAETLGLSTPEQFAAATQGAGAAGIMGLGASQQGLGQAFGYQPGEVGFERVRSGMFNPYAASQYMSPYIQEAIAPQLREARLAGDVAKQRGMLQSIQGGTFGGSRQALLQAEQERGTQQLMSDIVGKGYQGAYEQAMAQFNADQQRRLAAQQANQQAGLQAAGMTQQGEQYAAGLGKDIGIAGMQYGLNAAQLLGQLGTAEQQADLSRLTAQQQAAAMPQALEQQKLDLAYQDFLRQRDYPLEQLGFYSQILRGLPIQLASTQTSYQQPPSVASQLIGLGGAGYTLGKLTGTFAEGGEVEDDGAYGLPGLSLSKLG